MKRTGFGLIELMAVLLIVAGLAAMVMPSYQQHLVRARRSEAQSMLLTLMMQQERFFTQTNSYIAFSAASADPEARRFQWWSEANPQVSAYEIEGKPCDGELITQCVQLVATPGTALVDSHFRDEDCRVLTLTSNGLRLASGPAIGCGR